MGRSTKYYPKSYTDLTEESHGHAVCLIFVQRLFVTWDSIASWKLSSIVYPRNEQIFHVGAGCLTGLYYM